MKVGARLWTTLAAAVLMALPLSTAAQSTSSTQSGQSSTPAPQSGQETTQTHGQSSSSSKSRGYYLEQATKDLDSLSSSFKSTDAGQDLERHFRELRVAYERDAGTSSEGTEMSGTSGTSGSSSATGSSAPPSVSTEPGRMARTGDTWRTHYRQIEDTLDSLSVARSSAWMPVADASGSTSGTSGTSGSGSTTIGSSSTGSMSGTSGSGSTAPGSSATAASPNAADLGQLNQFRANIEMFYQSMVSSSRIGKDRD